MLSTVEGAGVVESSAGVLRPDVEVIGTLITIPAYNENLFLARSVAEIDAALAGTDISYRLSVAEDGSNDGTKELLRSFAESYPRLIVRSEPMRRGRGHALRQLWNGIDADVYAFVDADLASSPSYLISAIRAVKAGSPIVVGSRYAEGATVCRPPLRNMASLGYNWLVRTMFDEPIRDHQCGLKVFSGNILHRLLPLTSSDSWFWDTEVLVVANRLGVSVKELPIFWKEPRATRTPIPRLLSDIRIHGEGLLRLRVQLAPRVDSRVEAVGVGQSSAT